MRTPPTITPMAHVGKLPDWDEVDAILYGELTGCCVNDAFVMDVPSASCKSLANMPLLIASTIVVTSDCTLMALVKTWTRSMTPVIYVGVAEA